jgi:hypothetical protein
MVLHRSVAPAGVAVAATGWSRRWPTGQWEWRVLLRPLLPELPFPEFEFPEFEFPEFELLEFELLDFVEPLPPVPLRPPSS